MARRKKEVTGEATEEGLKTPEEGVAPPAKKEKRKYAFGESNFPRDEEIDASKEDLLSDYHHSVRGRFWAGKREVLAVHLIEKKC